MNFLFPKQNQLTVGIIYKPPRSNKISRNTFRQFKLAQYVKQRMAYTRGSGYKLNGSILGEENKNIIKGTNKISSETKKYLRFCKTFGLKQLIKSPTRAIPNTSTLIYHILTNTKEKITQCGLINIGLSNHQMIFCLRKIKKKKKVATNKFHLDHLKTSIDEYKEALGTVKLLEIS